MTRKMAFSCLSLQYEAGGDEKDELGETMTDKPLVLLRGVNQEHVGP